MARTLFFDQHASSLNNETIDTLIAKSAKIINDLSSLEGVEVRTDEIKTLSTTISGQVKLAWKQRFYVQKSSRIVTWNTIFATVHNTRASYYEFKQLREMSEW
ncbi:hypothetical protein AB4571_02695 [Vibrio breoganii]|uniref:hypothetical protein n=1 Tax=Vibrio breoganii TaxID=553239 RepID=UPI000C830E17|nr:hypothetical protein [Vibrio breoganii]PML13954.1 hypothetical protein BCT84_12400 [Vibrio breoganii]